MAYKNENGLTGEIPPKIHDFAKISRAWLSETLTEEYCKILIEEQVNSYIKRRSE